MLIDQRSQTRVAGQRRHRHQPRRRHEIRFVEDRTADRTFMK
jgi:hypothetical protein